MRADGEEFGEAGILRTVRASAALSPIELRTGLLAEVNRFCNFSSMTTPPCYSFLQRWLPINSKRPWTRLSVEPPCPATGNFPRCAFRITNGAVAPSAKRVTQLRLPSSPPARHFVFCGTLLLAQSAN